MDFNEYAIKYEYEEKRRQMQASVYKSQLKKKRKKAKKNVVQSVISQKNKENID